MSTKTTNIVLLAILLVAIAVGVFVYPSLPENVASHWNAAGNVNGTMPRFWGVFLLPLIMAVLSLLYYIIPKIDPMKANIGLFRGSYNAFWALVSLFLLYIHSLTLAWNIGYRFNFFTAIVPGLAVLFYVIGSILGKSKRNWFFGIRTPWTLSSDEVWDKTHHFGGILFHIAAVLSLGGIFFEKNVAVWFVLGPIIVAALIAVVYSYVVFKKIGA